MLLILIILKLCHLVSLFTQRLLQFSTRIQLSRREANLSKLSFSLFFLASIFHRMVFSPLAFPNNHLRNNNQPFNLFPPKQWFLRDCSTRLMKTLWEKVKLLVTSNFSFSHSVFYPHGELSAIFIKFEIVVCTFFQLRRV